MLHRFIILCLLDRLTVHGAAPVTSPEEAAWAAINIDRTFKGFPDQRHQGGANGLQIQRATEYEQIAKEFEAFRAKYPASKHAWTAMMFQIDYLHDALMMGKTNWFGPIAAWRLSVRPMNAS